MLAFKLWARSQQLRRAEFIRTYNWPLGLVGKLMKERNLTRKDAALVARGLRQFFIAYLMSGKKPVAMPSQVVDTLWHEFILYTRDYEKFCRRAFGNYLHHTPAAVMTTGVKSNNDDLKRVWWFCCRYESIDPKFPTRLPLIFALDDKLDIPDGFHYALDCETGVIRPGDYCATDIYRSLRTTKNGWTGDSTYVGGSCSGGSSCSGGGGESGAGGGGEGGGCSGSGCSGGCGGGS